MSNSTRREFIKSSSLAATMLAASSSNLFGNQASANKIKAAQIGTKHPHASGKLSTMRKLSDLYEVVGIVEPDEQHWNKVKGQSAYQGLPRLTEEQLFSVNDLQLVAVETAVNDLVPTALRCVDQGLHLHLDKPAGESMSAYRKLRKLADQKQVTIQLGYMLRYNPAFQFTEKAIKSGMLGTITEVSGMMGKLASPGLRKELSQYPGEGMYELACHLIDAVVSMLGKPEQVISFSKTVNKDGTAFKDNQLAVLQYETALATIRCNHIDPLGFSRRSFSVTGTLGTIAINPLEPPKLQLSLAKPFGDYKKGTQEITLPKSSGRYDGEFIDMAAIIHGKKQLAWSTQHDLAAHETILRASGLPVD